MAAGLAIESEALRAFKDAVLRKHGKLYGALREEATEAIRAHTKRLTGGDEA